MSLNNEIRDLIKEQINNIYDNTELDLRLPHRLKLSKSNDISYNDISFQYPGFKIVNDKTVLMTNIEIEGDLNNILQKVVMDYLDKNNIKSIKNNTFIDLYYIDKSEYKTILTTAKNYILSELGDKEYNKNTIETSLYHIGNLFIDIYHSIVFNENKTPKIAHLYISPLIKEKVKVYNIDEYEDVLFEKSKELYPHELNEILGNFIEIYNYKAKFKDVSKMSVFLSLVENTLFTKFRFNEKEELFTVEDISNDIVISNII